MTAAPHPRPDRRLLLAVVLVATASCGVVAVTNSGGGSSSPAAAQTAGDAAGVQADAAITPTDGSIALTSPGDSLAAAEAQAATDAEAADAAGGTGDATATSAPDQAALAAAPTGDATSDGGDLVGDPEGGSTDGGCTMTAQSIRYGSTGESVTCLQTALAAAGYYTGAISGQYDQATVDAVTKLQTERDLFVDGVAGRESGISLGIWPDEASAVIHTPPPAPGAVDLMGYPLSSVAVSGPDAPPLPENSGSGKRLVYDRLGQRVWAVDASENVIRSWLVSGSQYNNEVPGTWEVYSKSNPSTAWNGKAILPKMVRYYKTDIGNIGFHGIPIHVSDGTPYMTEDQLGTRLSGGCQRQANLDADFTWDFAEVGTTVVVI